MHESKELDINEFLNEFLSLNYQKNDLLFDYLNTFYQLSDFIRHNSLLEEEIDEPDLSKGARKTFLENFNLIDEFYKSIGIPFKAENIIKDGTIEIIATEDDVIMYGINNYIKGHKSITIYNNGLVTDSIVWIHEISHYRNQPEIRRSQVNDLLTESIAHTTSLIYTDYLEKWSYSYEAFQSRNSILQTFKWTSDDTYILTKMYLLYMELGDTSREAYKDYYGNDDDYEKTKEEFIKLIKENQYIIFNALWYTLSSAISIYMYDRYRKDNNFIDKIKELNRSLLNGEELQRCLNIIELDIYSVDNFYKIEEAYNNFKSLLIKSYRRVLKK